jgi:dCTP diphosphatase
VRHFIKEYFVIGNQKLAMALRPFAAERDWDPFHRPKNLATSISIEAAELLETSSNLIKSYGQLVSINPELRSALSYILSADRN